MSRRMSALALAALLAVGTAACANTPEGNKCLEIPLKDGTTVPGQPPTTPQGEDGGSPADKVKEWFDGFTNKSTTTTQP